MVLMGGRPRGARRPCSLTQRRGLLLRLLLLMMVLVMELGGEALAFAVPAGSSAESGQQHRAAQFPKELAFSATREANPRAPVVVLVRSEVDENVGSVARAMLNFGLWQLRLVSPTCDWRSQKARMMAVGADDVLEEARVFHDLQDALEDLDCVLATSAFRSRDVTQVVMGPAEAARIVSARGEGVGVVFGPESTGLANRDLVYATAVVQIPTSSLYPS